MKPKDINIVIVDTKIEWRVSIIRELHSAGYNVQYFKHPEDALEYIEKREKVNIVISHIDLEPKDLVTKDHDNYILPGEFGMEFYRQIKNNSLADKVIMYSSISKGWPARKNSFNFKKHDQFVEYLRNNNDFHFSSGYAELDQVKTNIKNIINNLYFSA